MPSDQEVKKVKTDAKATAMFEFNADETEATFKLEVKKLKDATAAHIHMAVPGKEGDVVVVLFSGSAKMGEFTGMLAEGKITAAALVGPMAGKKVSDLADEMAKGKLYVNIHTKQNPDGELRGKIR